MIDRVIRYASRTRRPFIWEGVYNEFRDVPAKGAGFDSEEWIASTRQATLGALESLQSLGSQPNGIPYDMPSYHSLFSLAVALLTQPRERIRVLDFGGGMGLAFANLLRSLGEPQAPIDCLVVDNERSCAEGARLFEQIPYVEFSPTLPRDLGSVDIVLLSGVLQFVEDYKSLLKRLAALNAPYWLFTFVPAGDIPTFASGQKNVPGSTIPVWFFNLGGLLQIMRSLGYRVIFKAAMERKFDMDNFPPSHRLPQQCNLLFQRVVNAV